MAMDVSQLTAELEQRGLTMRGAFHPAPDDGVPDVGDGRPAQTLVLVGNAGPGMWARFIRERDPGAHLLDDWSRDVLEQLAGCLGARALFPFARPYLPFQRWAQRAEAVFCSPLGILMHPEYGLWHGYRGALALADPLQLPRPVQGVSPCATCADKPCLSACPVDAFDASAGYDVPACTAHIASDAGSTCLETGCLARHACPIGRDYRYAPDQAKFHMAAFLKNNRAMH